MIQHLNTALPPELSSSRSLPGVQPLAPDDWLRRSDTYGVQMSEKRMRLGAQPADVLWEMPGYEASRDELLDEVLQMLPSRGYAVTSDCVLCPDGFEVPRTGLSPLTMLGQMVQEDMCLLEKPGKEHVLTGAVLCFPAGWTLSEKAGRPLTDIHSPVESYDSGVAARVQRLFDGVRPGRPLWRNNWLKYDRADLWQPHSLDGPPRAPVNPDTAPFVRAERQCILRLPRTRAVVFSIHSYVVRA